VSDRPVSGQYSGMAGGGGFSEDWAKEKEKYKKYCTIDKTKMP